MKRIAAALAVFFFCASVHAQLLTLGAGKGGGAASPASCAFVPAAFSTATIYIDWTADDGLGAFGKACIGGSTVAASTLGSFQGTGSSTSSSGLSLNGSGNFLFSNVTWLTQVPLTLYADYTINTLAQAVVFAISDGTTANSVLLWDNKPLGSTTLAARSVVSAATSNLLSGASSVATATPFKLAASFSSGARAVAVNGANTASDATSPPASGLTTATIGAQGDGSNKLTATIRVTAVFAAANNTTQLATLTTP